MTPSTPQQWDLARPRFRVVDLCWEAYVSITGNPARSLVTAIGTILGASAFVATLGLSSTLSHQVSASFDVRRATEVVVQPASQDPAGASSTVAAGAPSWQAPDALARLRRLNGTVAAGQRVTLPEQPVTRALGVSAGHLSAPVVGMDSGAFGVIEPHIVLGRDFDQFHDRTAAPVVLLPANLAHGLGIARVGVAVFINDRPYTVMDIFDDVARRPESLLSVVMPFDAAQALITGALAAQVKRDVIIKTLPGAAQTVGAQSTLALSPESPDVLAAIAPPDPRTLRREVEGNVTQLSIILSLVSLALGAVSIGNAATAGIAARTPEIGLRRAVGARPRFIFVQLVSETTLLGIFGGFVGAVVGVLITVGVSFANGWQPIVDVNTALLASGAGAAAGLVAGLLPAWRATRIQPVVALQR